MTMAMTGIGTDAGAETEAAIGRIIEMLGAAGLVDQTANLTEAQVIEAVAAALSGGFLNPDQRDLLTRLAIAIGERPSVLTIDAGLNRAIMCIEENKPETAPATGEAAASHEAGKRRRVIAATSAEWDRDRQRDGSASRAFSKSTAINGALRRDGLTLLASAEAAALDAQPVRPHAGTLAASLEAAGSRESVILAASREWERDRTMGGSVAREFDKATVIDGALRGKGLASLTDSERTRIATG